MNLFNYIKLRYSLNIYEIQIYEILVIPQVERYASKYAFNKFTIEVFQAAMAAMAEKAEQPTGNKWVFICNERMWTLVQNILGEYLARFKQATAYMYSKAANGYLNIGTTFQAYEFGGDCVAA